MHGAWNSLPIPSNTKSRLFRQSYHDIVLLFSVAILVLALTFKNSEVTTVAGGIYATDNLHNSGGGASRARRIKATRYGGE